MKMQLGDKLPLRRVFGETLVELGQENDNLVVIDVDVANSTHTHLFRDAFPNRFIQAGIAEQNAFGIAAGLSIMGFVPFVSAFAVFATQRAGDQIRNSIAHPRANVKINGSYGGLPTGRAGATHSAVEDIAVMRCLPNMTVLVPADPVETQLCTRLAMEIEGPVYLRTVRCDVPVIFGEDHVVRPGKAVHLRKGGDVTIISTGMMTPKTLAAVDLLAEKGIHAGLIHMPSLKPLDTEAIFEASETSRMLVTVENHSIIGGLGSAVCETVTERGACKVRRIGFKDIFLESGNDEELFSLYGMNVNEIALTVEGLLGRLDYS